MGHGNPWWSMVVSHRFFWVQHVFHYWKMLESKFLTIWLTCSERFVLIEDHKVMAMVMVAMIMTTIKITKTNDHDDDDDDDAVEERG